MDMSFEGACAIVTGSGSGIGKLMAEKLASQGARVAIWDVNEDSAQETAKAILDSGGEAKAFKVDCSDFDSVNGAKLATMEYLKKLNILINNAGIVAGKPLESLSPDEVVRVFSVNALSLFWTNKAFLPYLKGEPKAMTVTIASAAGLIGSARLVAYSASKFAAVGFTSSLRNELKKEGSRVRTLLVCPFYISTGMFEGVKSRFPRLLPILSPQLVAGKVVEAIRDGKERLILPPFAQMAGFIANAPVPIADRIENIFGINSCMDAFVGRRNK